MGSIQMDAALVFFLRRRPILRLPLRSDQLALFVDQASPPTPLPKLEPGLRTLDAAVRQRHPPALSADRLRPGRCVALPNPIRPAPGSCSAFPGDRAMRRLPESRPDNPCACCWLLVTAQSWSRSLPVTAVATYLRLPRHTSAGPRWSR